MLDFLTCIVSLCPLGYPCLAEYSDGVYYRATIINFASVEPVRILVHHVDFGSDDTLPISKYDHCTLQEFTLNNRPELN